MRRLDSSVGLWALVCALAVAVGCGDPGTGAGTQDEGPGEAGTEGNACYPNDSCNAGLLCTAGACVAEERPGDRLSVDPNDPTTVGPNNPTGGPNAPAAAVVTGPAGGDVASADTAANIEIPPGALSEEVQITIAPSQQPTQGRKNKTMQQARRDSVR